MDMFLNMFCACTYVSGWLLCEALGEGWVWPKVLSMEIPAVFNLLVKLGDKSRAVHEWGGSHGHWLFLEMAVLWVRKVSHLWSGRKLAWVAPQLPLKRQVVSYVPQIHCPLPPNSIAFPLPPFILLFWSHMHSETLSSTSPLGRSDHMAKSGQCNVSRVICYYNPQSSATKDELLFLTVALCFTPGAWNAAVPVDLSLPMQIRGRSEGMQK